jgi:hypothetical protein
MAKREDEHYQLQQAFGLGYWTPRKEKGVVVVVVAVAIAFDTCWLWSRRIIIICSTITLLAARSSMAKAASVSARSL